jgi:hypothetical protein
MTKRTIARIGLNATDCAQNEDFAREEGKVFAGKL